MLHTLQKPQDIMRTIEQLLEPPLHWIKVQLQRLWGIWSAFWISLTGFFVFLSSYVVFNTYKEKRAWRITFQITRYWARIQRLLMLIYLRNHPNSQIKADETYVIVSNHRSAIDIPLCLATCPVPFSFLAKIEVDRIPVLSYLARRIHVYVDRKSEEGRKKSFERMEQQLAKERSIHIFVEGTRNKDADSPLGKFYDGAFRLAILSQRPLVALTILHSANVMSPHAPGRVSPARVDCHWAAPIPTKGMTLEDVPALKEKVRQIMLEHLTQDQN